MPTKQSSGHFHAVGFYQDDASLCRIVADFIDEGFREGSPAIVIATRGHRDAVMARLRTSGVFVDRLLTKGALRMFDADDTLARFMKDGMPNAAEFADTFVPIMQEMNRGGKDHTIRAYGEMVDVLWQADMQIAAIHLEILWNQLANTQDFKLLCGYSMGNFYKDAAAQVGREDIRRQHTHIVPLEDQAAFVN
jgi:hypothetical protein